MIYLAKPFPSTRVTYLITNLILRMKRIGLLTGPMVLWLKFLAFCLGAIGSDMGFYYQSPSISYMFGPPSMRLPTFPKRHTMLNPHLINDLIFIQHLCPLGYFKVRFSEMEAWVITFSFEACRSVKQHHELK